MFKKKQQGNPIVADRPRKKIKAWKIIVLVIVVFLILRVIFGIFFKSGKDVLPAVDTSAAVTGTITSTLDTSGTIESELTRVYASPVDALVGEVSVEVGESVKKGEYLLTFDTSSLEESYTIAELQAKADAATSEESLSKSSKGAGELAASSNDINTLQGQIDALNGEISSLQAQLTQLEIAGNQNSGITSETAELTQQLENVMAQLAALEEKEELSDKEKEQKKELKEQKKSLEKEIEKKKKNLSDPTDLANNVTQVQAAINAKTSQITDLQTRLSEAQGKKSEAEASVLTEQAKAGINYSKQAAKLTLEQTAQDLNKAKAGVAADFNGIVTKIEASEGTAAVEGNPLISLASAEQMCVSVPVSKYNLTNLKEGETAEITFQDKTYQGLVSKISKLAEASESGAALVTVKIHIDQPDDSLVIGMEAKVSVQLGTVENALKVPVAAVNSDTQGDFVYVVEKGIVGKKYVTTGLASKEEIEIKEGLTEGEKVITTVDSSIMEGMQVTEQAQMTEGGLTDSQAGKETVVEANTESKAE